MLRTVARSALAATVRRAAAPAVSIYLLYILHSIVSTISLRPPNVNNTRALFIMVKPLQMLDGELPRQSRVLTTVILQPYHFSYK